MTSRRFALQPSKTPTLTGGDDRPQPACDGNWLPFEALIDAPRNGYARKECLKICNTCPIREKCWADNAEEEWAQSLAKTLRPQRDCDVEGCDNPHSARGYCGMHYSRARKGQEVA